MKFFVFLLFFSTICENVSCQNQYRIDSLLNVLPTISESEKVKALTELVWENRKIASAKAVAYGQEAVELAKTIKQEQLLTKTYNFMGVSCKYQDNHQQALYFFQKAHQLSEKYGDTLQLAHSLNNLGGLYNSVADYSQAVLHIKKAIKTFKTIKSEEAISGIAFSQNHLYNIYIEEKQYEKAEFAARQILDLRTKIKDFRGQGIALKLLGKLEKLRLNYLKSIMYYEESNAYFKKSNVTNSIADNHLEIAKIQFEYLKDLNTATTNINAALLIYEEVKNVSGLAAAYLAQGKIALQRGQLAFALTSLKQAENFANRLDNPEIAMETYLVIYETYQKLKQHEQALNAYKQYVLLKDTVYDTDKAFSMGLLRGDFKAYQKEQENKVLKVQREKDVATIKKQQLQNWVLIVTVLFVLTIAIILYFTNKKIHKINGILQQKNIEIEEKQRILEEQSKVLESKNNELEFYITSNAELEYFAQLASHDLKQPLRTVNSYVKLLQKAMKSENIVSTRVSEYLHFIAAGTKNMSIFIENLLAYSTISSKEKDIFEVVNLNDLMMLTIQNLRTQINESNVTIDFDNLPSELRVVKIKILQLLQNLISNAIKFSKPELPPVIDVRGIENEDFWELTVSDNGIGIPKNQQERIFKIFYRIHDQTKYEGNGIGLATCKKIIDQHNGKIWVTSEENVGTTFHFTILKH